MQNEALDSNVTVKNITRLYSLLLLQDKTPVTGYHILKRLQNDLDRTASPTYIYNFLRELKEAGYVQEPDKGSGFILTLDGEKFINQIMTRFDNLVEIAIKPKLHICVSCGAQLYEKYHTETIEAKELKFCCSHCAEAFENTLR